MPKGRASSRKGTENPFWLSYSDLMAALLLVFVLLLLVLMSSAQLELEQTRQELKEVKRIRVDIIRALRAAFEGTDVKFEIDRRTGAIRFRNRILFKRNQRTLSEQGKAQLNKFVPIYARVLLSEEFREYIAQITVEGHTDTTRPPYMTEPEGYLFNLELSQARAMAVVNHVFGSSGPDFPERQSLRSLLRTTGGSYMQLILDADGKEDADASRRVEFQFRLKHEELIEEMREILASAGAETERERERETTDATAPL